MVGDDNAIHAMLDGILNIFCGGNCSRNMILLVYGIECIISVDVVFQSETDLLSPRARDLSGFESMEYIPPRFPRNLKLIYKKAVSKSCTDIT